MSEPAICGRLQSSAAVLANKGRILLTFGETEQTELVNAPRIGSNGMIGT